MIDWLTRSWVYRFWEGVFRWVRQATDRLLSLGDTRGLAIKIFMGGLAFGLALLFQGTLSDYKAASNALRDANDPEALQQIPSFAPLVWQGMGVFFALVAFLTSLWIRESSPIAVERRGKLIVTALWIAAAAALCSWLPTDIVATREAIFGKALAGENPSIPAYLGKLFLITILILSVPGVAMIYFRLSLMDRYVVHSFLSPFSLCLFSFMAIWVIADITDNGPAFGGMTAGGVLQFYVVQIPFVILFVMPIAVLLSGLSSLSKLSKSNELISMIGAGRSVLRILMPLFVVGIYASLISLAFKYEWAPASVGYKEAVMDSALRKLHAERTGTEVTQDLWAKRGWMHVNEVDRRTWFVGRIPFRLSDEMADVVVWKLTPEGYPETMWKAERARWLAEAEPARWELINVKIYTYDEQHIPRIKSYDVLPIEDWSETPWKVLSSSQNPEYLGIPGLTMYLNANNDMDDVNLAPFRTNWWYVFAEPLSCLALILVAAPLGIVYSRRASMAGVTGAIVIFAMMYLMRGTFLALGQRGTFNPVVAAWGTNIVVAVIGVFMLWFRARNREIPKLSNLFRKRQVVLVSN
ncbi:MAG: LptF/LptG family permease [Verrucomicrobiales bacterium]|nr:LptF/LptG family permease [Verrucomicrobiales bacterium]